MGHDEVRAAEVVLPCIALDETIAFFSETLGFHLESISPADDPSAAVISGHGLRIRLVRDAVGPPGLLRVLCRDPAAVAGGATAVTAPNGTTIELVPTAPPLVLPPPQQAFVVTRLDDAASWVVGRAGMCYRDLIPGRQGGRFIASHISIPEGGPVADYVHFHRVRFQMIYCYRGWVRVVYEDQGPPFVLHAGDCVLQPPQIRHRVLESSPGMEVIEITCPAEHETVVDHELALPTPLVRPDRDFSEQRFVRHERASATWQPWRLDGFECRDTGIAAATGGAAAVQIVRPCGRSSAAPLRHDGELLFMFVLEGAMTVRGNDQVAEPLGRGDAVVLPPDTPYSISDCSPELAFLEVLCPPSN